MENRHVSIALVFIYNETNGLNSRPTKCEALLVNRMPDMVRTAASDLQKNVRDLLIDLFWKPPTIVPSDSPTR